MQARVVSDPLDKVKADALVIPIVDGEDAPAEVKALDRKLGGVLKEVAAARHPSAGVFMELTPVHSQGKLSSGWMLLVGVGKANELDPVRLRNALQHAGRSLRKQGSRSVAVLAGASVSRVGTPADVARAVTEGIALSNFEIGMLKSNGARANRDISSLSIVGLRSGGRDGTADAVRDGLALAEATNRARQWVNLPANSFTPTIFAEKVREAAKGAAVDLEVLDMDDMRKLKMGALLAVAQGSDEPARMIVLRYHGGNRSGPVLGLVGKGITFDSGGISIKPGQGMEKMKGDMGGGAAVVNAVLAIAALKPRIDVIGVVPTTENMPSGKATRPGDVVTASNGKTIEVINTDAEGRLILADGIVYAIGQGATHIVDVATLTGSISRTLGPVSTGAFSNDRELMDLVRRAADLAGERVWELPTWADYDGIITSEVADIRNSTVPWAGATTAALFIREFVGGRPWVHLDIAGSAWQDQGELKTIPKGPTGAGVRLLAHLAQLLAQASK